MSSIFDVSSSTLFSASLNQTAQLSNLAMRALNNGLELFVDKKYDQAIASFRRAASLDPKSSTANYAYDYMARSYSSSGNNDKAIQAYRESLRQDPEQADIHLAMANLLYTEERFDEAVVSYEKAVNLDPSTTNRYSLGQGYLAAGRYDEAEHQFALVKQMSPREPEADVGIGQSLAKMGRTDEAIKSFQNAIDMQRDYWNAYSEMGYALVEEGRLDEAREIVDTLEPNSSELASNLSQLIYEKAAPQMWASTKDDRFTNFPSSDGPGTLLSDMSTALATPGGTDNFAIVFSFDKPMDRASIQDVNNWSIGRAYSSNRADAYNFGNPVASTDVAMPSKPAFVFYDEAYQMATVVFKVTQNAAGNGTLDPSHVKFSFNGQDVLGIAMDENADEFTGFSGFA